MSLQHSCRGRAMRRSRLGIAPREVLQFGSGAATRGGGSAGSSAEVVEFAGEVVNQSGHLPAVQGWSFVR